MSLEPFFDWCDATSVGMTIRESKILFPTFETMHLLGLALVLGSMLIVNARFFGLGMKRQTASEVAQDFFPWTVASFAMMAVSGSLLFLAKARDLYEHKGWRFTSKITLLTLAIVFQLAIYPRLTRSEKAWPGQAKFAACISLMLWFATAIAGLTLEFL